MPSIKPKIDMPEAYSLFHAGSLLLARMHRNGIKISPEHYAIEKTNIARTLEEIEAKFLETDEGRWWKKKFKDAFNMDSNDQLRVVIYDHLGWVGDKMTAKGLGSVDKTILEKMDMPFAKILMQYRKMGKVYSTYIRSILREEVDGYIHPMFGLNVPVTFRSCVAKGSRIMTPCGDKNIEDIRKGDLVYSYDDSLQPRIKKVKWSGMTGHREIIRVHWKGGPGRYGYLDVTPEHLIRTVDGTYCEARNLMNLEVARTDHRQPKRRVLSGRRFRDRIAFTGKTVIEHRFIASELGEQIPDGMVVHHLDGNHYNNSPDNLKVMSKSNHSKHHCHFNDFHIRQKNIEGIKRAFAEGRMHPRKGKDHPEYLGLSKFRCLRLLSKARGKASSVEMDFTTFKKYASENDVDLKKASMRYGMDGRYWSKGWLVRSLKRIGLSETMSFMRFGFYRLQNLMSSYGISYDRIQSNQTGLCFPGSVTVDNHIIDHIETLKMKVDVYDIEVEDTHNFIANEICVHNSSQKPNFQNMPIRDEEQARCIRSGIIPRHKGWMLGEFDFSGLEVRVGACYHKDPVWISDVLEGDMHRDSAMDCYCLPLEEMEKRIRYCGKNKFVFPQCYGDYYVNCAKALWESIDLMGLKTASGIPLRAHLKSVGLGTYAKFENHIKKVEHKFWFEKYTQYSDWKDRHYAAYCKNGYADMFTGFRCSGLMSRNDVINYVVQGAAFHCLLKTALITQEWLDRKGMKSLIIGQIHDSMIMEIHPDELIPITRKVRRIGHELSSIWPWIIIPLDIDFEVARPDEPWVKKKEWDFETETWKKKE